MVQDNSNLINQNKQEIYSNITSLEEIIKNTKQNNVTNTLKLNELYTKLNDVTTTNEMEKIQSQINKINNNNLCNSKKLIQLNKLIQSNKVL